MADPRFYAASGPFALERVAEIAGAALGTGADPAALLRGVASLEAAGPEEVSFLDNRRYVVAFAASRAGACLVRPEHAARAPAGMALLLTETPYKGYARVARLFHPEPEVKPGIHPAATVHPEARLGPGVSVDAGAVIGGRAEVGAGSRIGPNAVIGEGVAIGEACTIGANATLSHCLLGARVVVYPGACIGQDGFGFAMERTGHVKVPQLGRVLIGDDVEIGANTCVDRGSASDTVIGAGCMIDNLVQIGHNVRLGRGCVLIGQVGISGSTRLDDLVVVGGQGGLAGHLHIGAGARIAARSGVHRDIAAGQEVGGSPAVPIGAWRRQVAILKRLGQRKGD
ncbi:MAG: UDP-3-O-(3-hydroxymyristoyl)glucosamine N-acyltransferase [Pseudomonadota bacterium]